MSFSAGLREAAWDYRSLLDRGYSVAATLALVGNRWRLSAEERLVLFRGVASTADSRARSERLAVPGPGGILLVDLYNVAFTIVHYLIGKPCFISSDGFLRDAGANYGRVPHDEELQRAFGLVARALLALAPERVEAYLDAPVSKSGSHAAAFRQAWDEAIADRAGPARDTGNLSGRYGRERHVAAHPRPGEDRICLGIPEAGNACMKGRKR